MQEITSTVITGSGRGKSLGYATFNLVVDNFSHIEEGIYAVIVSLDESSKRLPAAMHLGTRPVFNDSKSCEVHILDKGDFEAKNITVYIIKRIRDVKNFKTPQLLVEQIESDIATIQNILYENNSIN